MGEDRGGFAEHTATYALLHGHAHGHGRGYSALRELIGKVSDRADSLPHRVDKVSELVHEVSNLVDEVPELVHEVSDLVHKVSNLVDEVLDLVHKVPELVHEVSDLVHKVSNLVDKVPELVHEVSDLVHKVRNLVDKIRNLVDEVQNLVDEVQNLVDEVQNLVDSLPHHVDKVPELVDKASDQAEEVALTLDARPAVAQARLCNGEHQPMLPLAMSPRFLFLTGEPAATLPLLKTRPDWAPVLSAIKFDVIAGRLHRRRSATDDFRGCVYFADVRDKDIERHNLGVLARSALPCWPDPAALLALSDRHAAMARCVSAGIVQHPVEQARWTKEPLLPFPYVLKIGDEHRGEGKHLIRSAADIVPWDGIATMEPFFDGVSVRVLCLGDRVFGARIHNDSTWIKNAPGASFEPWDPDPAVAEHAQRAKHLFDLEIAGVDYVIDRTGPHFIELNPFPRVGLSKESAEAAREIFAARMDAIEARAQRAIQAS